MTTQREELEIELDTQQCVEVALYMYEQWRKAMKPPVFAVYDFPTWLAQLKTLTPSTTGEEK